MCDMSSRPSTWYEEERSRILYTCEEKFDGNMVAYVIDLERRLTHLKQERDELTRCLGVKCIICEHADLDVDEGPCHVCDYTNGYKSFVCRGIQDQKVKLKPLTLENVKPGEVLFIEFFNQPDIERVEIVEGFAPNLVGYYEEFGGACRHNVDEISYGQYWRCWASRPTEEERAAAPWDQKGSERA